MARVVVDGAALGSQLQDFLACDEIQPGSPPSYPICKIIYEFHPLGMKMAAAPVKLAQSQARDIAVPIAGGLEERLKKEFQRVWREMDIDNVILNVKTLSRVYGLASVVTMCKGVAPDQPIDIAKVADLDIRFNVLDPLNTSGSLVLNQDPNALDFQKVEAIAVAGVPYHRSRAFVVMNERPIYISYTSSAYGFVGRSVYQRGLYPLKSFLETMITNNMVAKKAGLLVVMIQTVSSAVDRLQEFFGAMKRSILAIAAVDNVLQIGEKDKAESLNLQNLEGPLAMARKNILEDLAVSADMPAVMLNSETFAEGFSDGSEDAKNVAHYVDKLREEMALLYAWFDLIVMHKAWSPAFFKTIQHEFPEQFRAVDYVGAFYDWKNSFNASWPNLLTEPDSEKVRTDEVKLKAAVAVFQVAEPICDPENKAKLLGWLADVVNSNKTMFPVPLELDLDDLEAYLFAQPQAGQDADGAKEPSAGPPFAAQDAVRGWLGAPNSLSPRRERVLRALADQRAA
jgi:hypothetical protein